MTKNLVPSTYKLRSFVYVWHSPTESELYQVEGKLNGFSSYVECWQWIYANNLQHCASACEQYVPINANHRQTSGLMQLIGCNR